MDQSSTFAPPLFAEAAPKQPNVNRLPIEAGYFAGDGRTRELFVREQIRSRVLAQAPIFPARKLGLEFAAMSLDTPRGIPLASVAIANLNPGESFPFRGRRFTVDRIGARIEFSVSGGELPPEPFRTSPDMKNWEQFERDVEGLLLASIHGCDAGDLLNAWRRDPIAGF